MSKCTHHEQGEGVKPRACTKPHLARRHCRCTAACTPAAHQTAPQKKTENGHVCTHAQGPAHTPSQRALSYLALTARAPPPESFECN